MCATQTRKKEGKNPHACLTLKSTGHHHSAYSSFLLHKFMQHKTFPMPEGKSEKTD